MRLSTLQPVLELPQRVRFLCPKCLNHNIRLSFGSGWSATGSTVEDLTITPSLNIQGGCKVHLNVIDGEVSVCG